MRKKTKKILIGCLLVLVGIAAMILRGYFSLSVRTYLATIAKREGMYFYEKIITAELEGKTGKLIYENGDERIASAFFDVDKAYYLMGRVMNKLRTSSDEVFIKTVDIPCSYLFLKQAFFLPNITVPVETSTLRSYEVAITNTVNEYGINSSLVGLNLNVKIAYTVMIPFISEVVELEMVLPLALEVINSEVPLISLKYE